MRLYDSHGAQRPVGAQDWTTIWLLPAFRGRGLLSAAVGLRWHRLGRDPIDYLWRAAAGSPFTPAGRRSCFAAHREGVRLARAEGLSVSRAVLRSLRLGVDLGDNPRALDPRLAGRFPMSPSTLETLERAAQERGRMDLWRAFASRVVAAPATPR